MKKKTRVLCSFLVFAFSGFFLFPATAHAYLDPGSGSYILQIILAGALAAILAVKSFWRAAWAWIRNLFNKPKNS